MGYVSDAKTSCQASLGMYQVRKKQLSKPNGLVAIWCYDTSYVAAFPDF
jgi:hypothetical protein